MAPIPNQYNANQYNNSNNIEYRINKIESQIKDLNQRLMKLENPYNKEPDNNMYMM